MEWYWVDLAIIGIILLSIFTGLFRGFVKEALALCIWGLAIWVAFNYSHLLDPWLQKYIQDKTARNIATFTLLLTSTIVAGALVNGLLGFILKRSGLSGTDRLFGMVFGLARGIFIVALCMVVVKMTSLPYEQYDRQSKLYAQFNPMVNWIYDMMPGVIGRLKAIDQKKEFANSKEDMQLS